MTAGKPHPDDQELQAELFQFAAAQIIEHDHVAVDALTAAVSTLLGMTFNWPQGPAEARAAQVAAQVHDWQNGDLHRAYRDWLAQEPKRRAARDPRPRIDCGGGGGPKAIREVQQALNDRKIPGTYQVAGRVAVVWEGEAKTRETSTLPLAVEAVPATPGEIQNLLAHHTYCTKFIPATRNSPAKTVEHTPPAAVLTAVLASRSWPGLRPLNGVIGAPVLRPDGTLLQEPGYDEATGLYLASLVDVPQIPARPPQEWVESAKDLMLNWLLGNFPWVGPADKANFLAMLVTQVLRHYLGGSPVPFFPITAPAQGSGKTLLAMICGVLFGQASVTWTGDDEELRKTLTSVLAGQEGVITFDNLAEGTQIRSAVLSKLLTDRTWGDRMLGKNVLGQFANNRLWCATGNNLRVGGDLGSRVVLIGLDAKMPHPETRIGFKIADLESWIREAGNQRKVLTAVLVLVADWAEGKCPEADVTPMRQFTRWARVCGGFLAWHGVDGFLANAGEAAARDDDNASWAGFLARWQQVLGAGPVRASKVAESRWDPRWEDTFPAGRGDEPLELAKSVGRRLGGQKDRYHGMWVLRGEADSNDGVAWWWVEAWPGERGDIHKTWNGKPSGTGPGSPGWSGGPFDGSGNLHPMHDHEGNQIIPHIRPDGSRFYPGRGTLRPNGAWEPLS